MELSQSLSLPKTPPQNQVMVYQNTTIIYSQTFVTTQTINAPNQFNFLFIVAALLFLALGFLLGLVAMLIFSGKKKSRAKNQKSSSIILNNSQKSTAESENNNIPAPNENRCEARSSSTESSPALNSSSSATSDKENLRPLSLENNSSDKIIDNIANSIRSDDAKQTETRIVPLTNNASSRDLPKTSEFSYASNSSKNSSEFSSNKLGTLLQLKIQEQFSHNSQQAEAQQFDKFGKIQLHQSKHDIHSYHEESDIHIHEDDGKIIKVEKTVNKTVYTEKKTEELKQLINNYIPTLEKNSNASSPELFLVNQSNKLPLAASESDQMGSSERASQPTGAIANKTSSTEHKSNVTDCQHLKRQSTFEEGKVKNENKIELFTIPSNSIKSGQMKQTFPHLTGFFDKVFDDKTLIGRGGFGEVYKVTHKLEQKLYAVKKVKLLLKDNEDIRQNKFFREVSAMTSLHHPHIVRHHTTWTEEPPSSLSPQQIIRKSLSNRKLTTMLKKSQESFSKAADRTKISDLGFQWDVSEQRQNSKVEKMECDSDSESEEMSESFSRMKTLSQIQASLIEEDEDKSDEEVLSALNATLMQKLKDHQLIYLFMQMEYCSGDSLMNFLDNRRAYLSKSEIIKIFKQIVEGVISIHDTGILHRDLKPSNIFFEKGFIKIGDFGLSWLGEQQDELETTLNLSSNREKSRKSQSITSNIGTPFYISPEQEKSTTYTNKTDIYSLGIILFELISCFTTRHERGEKIKALRERGYIDPQLQELFPDFSDLILKMINSNPEERPSAKETLAVLEKIASKS